MRKTINRILKCSIVLILGLFLSIPMSTSAESEKTVLRVAFPELEGFTTIDENGNRHGLVVDYLNEISKYTGWEYEFVPTSADDMITEFLDGKFDLMGGTYYGEGLDRYFAYPDYSTGQSKSVLLARWDDTRISGSDLKNLNGMTIGVYDRASENIRRLREFLSMNDIECTIHEYSNEESIDGNFYYYLEKGDVDLLLGNESEDTKIFRAVAYFDAQPHYIVTQPNNKEVLDGLNWAMKQIVESNPNFADECYEKNFPGAGTPNVVLNLDELAYVKEKKTVMVAIPDDYHPFYCQQSDEKIHDGIVPDMLLRVSEFSGLEFEYLYTETYAEALQAVENDQADMVGFFLGSEQEASEHELALTQSFVSLSDLIVRNKKSSYPSSGLTCALLKGRQMPTNIEAEFVKYYDTTIEMLEAVNQGEVDFAYGLSAQMEQVMQQHFFANIVPVTLFDNTNDISFALSKPAPANLLTIINKSLSNITEKERVAIANQNLVSVGTSSMTLKEVLYSNPTLVITVSAAILILLAAIVIIINQTRLKTYKISMDLEKAEADSRAKSAFLSRMSHEIRTPMNAIVGLTDLIGVQEGVPESIQLQLTKLRSSSRYLLGLINDILDMSRIDSNMMNVSKEPFSLIQMLDELYSMMKGEAERRNLTFIMNVNVEHSEIVGDSIRLRQVLTNLISNAIKFTPSGEKIELYVNETQSEETSASYTFKVVDNGIGISPENQERIFDAFEQVGSNISRSQGTGLGLPISRNLVRLMGGELELISEVNKGCEFFFTLSMPYGVVINEPIMSESDALDGVRILLVEDNEINAEIAKELLEIQGAFVTWVTDGKQAVDKFAISQSNEYQIILMDIQMPVMNGLEATRQIRKLEHPDALTIPVVAMTANSFQEDVEAAKDAGMNAFITKPLDVKVLYSELQKLVK